MKIYEYIVIRIDVSEEGSNFMDILNSYGERGWRFAGWYNTNNKINNQIDIREAVFEKEKND
jgi:hypothetical protein